MVVRLFYLTQLCSLGAAGCRVQVPVPAHRHRRPDARRLSQESHKSEE